MEGVPRPRTSPNEATEPLTTRRAFIAGAGAAAVGYGAWRSLPAEPAAAAVVATESVLPDAPESTPETVESEPLRSEQFLSVTAGYEAQYHMENEVLFVAESGAPVATVRIEPINGISPGASYDPTLGVVTEGFSRAWRTAARARVAAAGGDPSTLRIKTNWNAIRKAVADPDEAMTYENTRSIEDVVRYFGEKPVRAAEEYSRIEYVRERISFSGNLAKAPVVMEALRECIPGLCALESKFNDDVTSAVGARGIFQMKPDTWHKELGRPEFADGQSVPLTEQVKAAGELFSKMYDRVRYWCYEEPSYGGRNYLEEIKAAFASQEDFERYFLVPLLVNAYNTGEKGMGDVVHAFVESGTFHRTFGSASHAGFDVFQALSEYGAAESSGTLGNYGSEASTYVQRVYAFARLLAAEPERDEVPVYMASQQ